MFQIFKEEYLDITMQTSFTSEEFESITSKSIASPDLMKILQSMYQSGSPREYARVLFEDLVVAELGARENITQALYAEGIFESAMEFAEAA